MPWIVPGRTDLKYLPSFSHKYIQMDWLHVPIENIMRTAVEETKM